MIGGAQPQPVIMPVGDAVAGDVVRRQQPVGGGTKWDVASAVVRTWWDIAATMVRWGSRLEGRDWWGRSPVAAVGRRDENSTTSCATR